ncbi:hypothetical protein GYMLUDRAFT_78021 [Collybiopsis luxurians FD-317 M1]|uniref:Uncharacterized protein n=1 Tax=Collybiopsis luxurians FD-317 M1 TaxID=944289 RepID=A0A0D0BQX5_9AGAR|nr:hypothetical protein GYMLUDRAFT_78021 [Collybiopsis luxurians FD-317 M1]
MWIKYIEYVEGDVEETQSTDDKLIPGKEKDEPCYNEVWAEIEGLEEGLDDASKKFEKKVR